MGQLFLEQPQGPLSFSFPPGWFPPSPLCKARPSIMHIGWWLRAPSRPPRAGPQGLPHFLKAGEKRDARLALGCTAQPEKPRLHLCPTHLFSSAPCSGHSPLSLPTQPSSHLQPPLPAPGTPKVSGSLPALAQGAVLDHRPVLPVPLCPANPNCALRVSASEMVLDSALGEVALPCAPRAPCLAHPE